MEPLSATPGITGKNACVFFHSSVVRYSVKCSNDPEKISIQLVKGEFLK